MENNGTVNDQITDSVSQMNTLIVGSSVPQSIALLDIAGADAFGMSMHNAVTTQQNAQVSSSASVTAACARMLQAQQPAPATPMAETSTPPPFMPLNTTAGSPSDLISKADTLAKAAVSMLGQKDKLDAENTAEIKKLVATLSRYIDTDTSDADTSDSKSTDKTNDKAATK